MKNEVFIYGDKNIPEWVQNGFKEGKLIERINEETDEKTLIVNSSTKVYELNEGDVLVSSNHGFVGLPREKAGKFIKKPIKKEETENE